MSSSPNNEQNNADSVPPYSQHQNSYAGQYQSHHWHPYPPTNIENGAPPQYPFPPFMYGGPQFPPFQQGYNAIRGPSPHQSVTVAPAVQPPPLESNNRPSIPPKNTTYHWKKPELDKLAELLKKHNYWAENTQRKTDTMNRIVVELKPFVTPAVAQLPNFDTRCLNKARQLQTTVTGLRQQYLFYKTAALATEESGENADRSAILTRDEWVKKNCKHEHVYAVYELLREANILDAPRNKRLANPKADEIRARRANATNVRNAGADAVQRMSQSSSSSSQSSSSTSSLKPKAKTVKASQISLAEVQTEKNKEQMGLAKLQLTREHAKTIGIFQSLFFQYGEELCEEKRNAIETFIDDNHSTVDQNLLSAMETVMSTVQSAPTDMKKNFYVCSIKSMLKRL